MILPQSNTLTTNRLNNIFRKTVATYKYYWFIGILDLYVKKGMTRMDIWDIMVEMVVNAWYPVTYFNLSFGKSDSMQGAITRLQKMYDIPINISKADLRKWLHGHKNETEVRQCLNFLKLNVPYWFLRPWIDVGDTGQIAKRSLAFENGCLYSLKKDAETIWIELNKEWLGYLQENYVILRDFAYWNLASFVQVRNPYVPNVIEKLVKVESRQSLQTQHRYWDYVLEQMKSPRCIYTGKILSVGVYDLDHFIPWRFVSHNLVWNLVPADGSINSSKSDKLPSLEDFLPKLALVQQKAVRIAIKGHFTPTDILDDYLTLGCTPQELSSMNRDGLIDCFKRTFSPMHQLALNMGFEQWNR